jgi:hypothetical protein
VNSLEQQLIDLGAALDVPATPDLMAGARERLTARPARRRRLVWFARRRPLGIAIAIVAVLSGTAAAVPPLRHAVERLFDLNGAVVERVPRLPPLPNGPGARLKLGRRIPVADAEHATSFRALLPPRGVVAAYVATEPPGGRISLVIGHSLLMEFRGQSQPFIEKLVGPGTRVRRVRVSGGPGVYLDRAPHAVIYMNERGRVVTDLVRREGAVLLWQHGPLILRIEGAGSLARALALARSLR